MRRIFFTIIIALLVCFGFIGCDLIGNDFFLPDYMGTWSYTSDAGTKLTFIFAREDWEFLSQMDWDGTTYDLGAEKGVMSNGGGVLTVYALKEKKATQDVDGMLLAIAEGTEWTDISPVPESYKLAWAVEGDKLTLTYPDESKLVLTEVKETE